MCTESACPIMYAVCKYNWCVINFLLFITGLVCRWHTLTTISLTSSVLSCPIIPVIVRLVVEYRGAPIVLLCTLATLWEGLHMAWWDTILLAHRFIMVSWAEVWCNLSCCILCYLWLLNVLLVILPVASKWRNMQVHQVLVWVWILIRFH